MSGKLSVDEYRDMKTFKNQTYSMNVKSIKVIDKILDELESREIFQSKRELSKSMLLRFALMRFCPDLSDESIDKSIKDIEKNIMLWD